MSCQTANIDTYMLQRQNSSLLFCLVFDSIIMITFFCRSRWDLMRKNTWRHLSSPLQPNLSYLSTHSFLFFYSPLFAVPLIIIYPPPPVPLEPVDLILRMLVSHNQCSSTKSNNLDAASAWRASALGWENLLVLGIHPKLEGSPLHVLVMNHSTRSSASGLCWK